MDEVIVTKNNQSIVYKARYQEQRTFIAEVFRFAIARDLEIKVKSHFVNPNEENFQSKKQEQESNLKLAQQAYFKLIKNDRVLPPCALLTYKLQQQGQLISLGMQNIVIHGKQQYYALIPYMSDSFYLETSSDPKTLGLHVGRVLNYCNFATQLEMDQFKMCLQQRRKGHIHLEAIFIHFNTGDIEHENQLVQYKRIKLKEISQEIDSQLQRVQTLQLIKEELEKGVMSAELNSVAKSKLVPFQKSSQILFDFSKVESPSFQQQ